MQIASFQVADGLYGIPVLLVEEFFRAIPVTPVPLSDRRIEGLIHHRGKTATVLDLRCCLDKEPLAANCPSKMILLETTDELTEEARALGIGVSQEPVVLRVDATRRIFTVRDEEILPRPAHIPHTFVDGVIRSEDEYLMMLSICNLIETIVQE